MASLALFGVFRGFYDSNTYPALYHVIRPESRATATGMFLAAGFLGGGFAPVVVGWMAEKTRPRTGPGRRRHVALLSGWRRPHPGGLCEFLPARSGTHGRGAGSREVAVQVDIILEGLAFPEGPAFASDGSLWCVELKGERVVRWRDGAAERYTVGGTPNGIAIDARDRVWFCDAEGRAIRRMDTPGRPCTDVCRQIGGEPLNKPNDLAFDSRGNLVFTCPGESPPRTHRIRLLPAAGRTPAQDRRRDVLSQRPRLRRG